MMGMGLFLYECSKLIVKLKEVNISCFTIVNDVITYVTYENKLYELDTIIGDACIISSTVLFKVLYTAVNKGF